MLWTFVFKMSYMTRKYTGPGMNLWIPLPSLHTCEQKTLRYLCWFISPTMLTHTFWVCKQRAKWTKGPAKETCYYLNWAAAHRSTKARSQWLLRLHLKSTICFGSMIASVTKKKKKVKSHGKLFEVSLTPGNPLSPHMLPIPQLGRWGTLYRGSAGCPTNEAST